MATAPRRSRYKEMLSARVPELEALPSRPHPDSLVLSNRDSLSGAVICRPDRGEWCLMLPYVTRSPSRSGCDLEFFVHLSSRFSRFSCRFLFRIHGRSGRPHRIPYKGCKLEESGSSRSLAQVYRGTLETTHSHLLPSALTPR